MAYKDVIEQASTTAAHEHGFGAAQGKTPAERFAYLQDMCSTYLGEDEENMLAEAFAFADAAHAGQKRKSGEPFIAHPVEVAIILASLHMDAETIAAALLHDTIEDTDVSREDVVERFGDDVANLVEGVTKITKIEVGTLSDEQAATIRKMLVAMNKDIRV
ncbi:MAG TPA: GTP pyrophosphokinase, partial [Eggerthellaceae bacterium]|nr:GTP pyrophosphokinase [Eggerthellaceae bacterium]